MAKRIIAVKPVTELELQFESGESLTLRFDVEALLNFDDFEDGIVGMIEKSMPELCAKIIYIGAKNNDSGMTIEKARELTSSLSPITITEIINEFNESMGVGKNEVQKELQKKLMQQFLEKLK